MPDLIGSSSTALIQSCNSNPHIWHLRLGHVPSARLQKISNLDPSVKVPQNHVCEICPLARQKKLPYLVSNSQSNKIFQLVHVDIWGPLSTKSHDGYLYFLTIVDNYSSGVWIYLMKYKSEARALLQSFWNMIHTQFKTKIKIIMSDQGK